MEYIDAEKLKERVTELIASTRQKDWPIAEYYLKKVIDIIDSLQQQPKVDFERELEKWRHEHFKGKRDGYYNGEYLTRTSQLDIARYFYKLKTTKEK